MVDWDRGQRRLVALVAVFVVFVGIAAGATLTHTTAVTQNDDGTILNQPGGPSVNMTGNTEVSNQSGDLNSTAVRWVTTDGNLTAVSNGDTEVTVDVSDFNSTWTNATDINATEADLSIATEEKPSATVGENVTALSYQTSSGIGVDDGQTDFVYSASGSGTVTLRNLPASTTFRAATVSGTDLGTVTTDSSGVGTISVAQGTNQQVVFFNPALSDRSPNDGSQLSSSSVTLAINVSDSDFPSRQGDSVTAEFFLDGTSVGTDTLSSNGTASTTTNVSEGGEHTWTVTVQDNYGTSQSSQTFDISTPSTLFVRSETRPNQLVNNTEVQITAYYDRDEVQRRTVSDGTFNLTGFPVDEPIIISVNATNYTTRTAVIENIYEQQSVYLLNGSVAQYQVRFQLQQLSGQFPEDDTVLFVEREIELNGSVEWRTVAGDQFGVTGVPMFLQQQQRYRIRIKNLETGRAVVIGAYTPVQNETVSVSAGSAEINLSSSEREYGWEISENESTNQILVEYEDTANQTESIRLTIHQRFNRSNVLVDNATFTDTNSLVHQISLTDNQSNLTWMAELYVDRGDGYMHFRVPIGSGTSSLLPDALDSVWVNGAGVFIMLISALAFSKLNVGVGAVATSLIGAILWWFGILSDVAIGAGVVAAVVVAVVYHYRTRQGVVSQ